MKSNEKLIYFLQGATMVLIFVAPLVFSQFRMPFSELGIYQILALIFGLLGMFIVLSAIKVMGTSFETRPAPKEEGNLITEFPFSISRNPMYVGAFFLTLSWALANESLVTLILSFVLQIILVLKVQIEENLLEKKFGADYLEYKKNTPRWLLF